MLDNSHQHLRLKLAALLLCLAVSGVALAGPPAGYPFLAFGDALAVAESEQKPILVYFARHGCSPCLRTEHETFSQFEVRSRLSQNYVLAYVDTEGDRRSVLPSGERVSDLQIARRFRVLGTPTFVYVRTDQGAQFSVAGYQTADDFVANDQRMAALKQSGPGLEGR